MRTSSAFRTVSYALIAIGILGGLMAGALRYRAEQRNRRVAIAVDYSEVEEVATAAGIPVTEALNRLASAGVNAVAITEDTLGSLSDKGLASISGTERLTTVRLADPALVERVAREWNDRGMTVVAEPTPRDAPYVLLWCPQAPGRTVVYRGAIAALRQLGVGLPKRALADVAAARLEPVARISNFPRASEGTLQAVLSSLAQSGIRLVICTGTEVLGYQGQHKEAAQAFESSGVFCGSVEFGKQKGDDRLAAALKGHLVRVHSISEGEMGTMSEGEAIERFTRAARERNIRFCYVRLLTLAGADPLAADVRYIRSIVSGIAERGMLAIGTPRPFDEPGVPRFLFPIVGLGVGVLATLLVLEILPGAYGYRWHWLIGLCIIAAVLAAAGDTGRRLVALLAAITAPSLAVIPLVRLCDGSDAGDSSGAAPISVIRRGLQMLLSASGITCLGIVSVVGLLASRPYMVKVNQFLGIKAAHALPIAIAAVLLVVGAPAVGAEASQEWQRMKKRLQDFCAEPVLAGIMVLTLAILGAMALALMRTGNDPGVGVSGMELRFRSLLDAILPVRPRTKEFLIGHPALILAAVFALRGNRRWAAPALLVGVLGQASMLNTFCHIHTYLTVSLMRAFIGLLLGAVLGMLIASPIPRFWPRQRTETLQTQ